MTVSHVIVELWEKKTFHSVNSSVLQLELTDIPFKNKVTKNQNVILASFFIVAFCGIFLSFCFLMSLPIFLFTL